MATKLHRELGIRSVSWMNSRMTKQGMRWATEFFITKGWVADCCVLGFPQIRFFEQLNKEISYTDVWKKNGLPPHLVYVFESKISKTDYNKSFGSNGNKRTMIGNVHYVVTPKDLITTEQLPEGWGWLIKSGNGLKEIVRPTLNQIDERLRLEIGYRMLWSAYGHRASIEDWELRTQQLF